MQRLKIFLAELLRRKVVRLLCGYLVLLWVLAQGIATLSPSLGLPDWLTRAVVITGLVLAPILAIMAWKYDLVLPHLVRDTKDIAATNPGQRYAALRHDHTNAGTLLLRWALSDDSVQEKRFFDPVTFGREAGNDIELDDPRVSRFHAVVWAENGLWHVRDLDSANGTFLDGKAVQGSATLPANGKLRLHPEGPEVTIRINKSAETIVQIPQG